MGADLAEYISRRANDSFRGLARYSGDDLEVVHSRDDLEERDMRERAETIHRAVRPRGAAYALDELGETRATVQMRADAVILHFPVDGDTGYLVGLEPDIARDLSSFIDDGKRLIEDGDLERTGN